MVGVIILYDHVHPQGAFVKSSSIDIKGSIKVLKEQSQEVVEGLLNALRYATKCHNNLLIIVLFTSLLTTIGIQPSI